MRPLPGPGFISGPGDAIRGPAKMKIFAGGRCGSPWTSWKATWPRSWLIKRQRIPATRRPQGVQGQTGKNQNKEPGRDLPVPAFLRPPPPLSAPGSCPISRGRSHFSAPAGALTFMPRPAMIGRRLYTKIGDFPGLFLPLLKTLQNLCTFAGNRAKIIKIASGPSLAPFSAGCSAKPRKDVIS